MSRKISRSLINGRTGAGTAGQGLKVEWDSTNDGELHWMDVSESSLEYVAPAYWGDRAVCGGYFSGLEYVSISTPGNATVFGNTSSSSRYGVDALSNGTRGVWSGGGAYLNIIDYITISTTSNATDFGDLITGKRYVSCTSNLTRGFINGGTDGSSLTDIEYITVATTGNATDFGDLITGMDEAASTTNGTRALVAGGNGSTAKTDIVYITMDTPGNATDFGDMTVTRGLSKGCCNDDTRSVFVGGFSSPATGGGVRNVIDYVTTATTGNATDFGDLSRYSGSLGGTEDGTIGIFMGGHSFSGGWVAQNNIDYITIQTTGNATDFGDLIVASFYHGACSGD